MDLRQYQTDAIRAVARGYHEGFDKQLLVMATGAGKTICLAALAQRFQVKRNERTLILAHREELIQQAVDKIHKSTGIIADIEKAEFRARLTAPVVVASVQTLQGARLQRWPSNHFGLVVADEAHHSTADSWQRTLNYFDPFAKILGVTATPNRGDKKDLGKYYQNIPYEIGLIELIQQGYLCPVVIRTLPIKIDLANVKSVKGDYDANQLADAVEPLLRTVVQEIIRCAGNRKILVFLPLRKTSKLFVDLLTEAGILARHVDGESEDRADILSDFNQNKFQVLCNSQLLYEGYDQPDIDCVINLTPTRSAARYSQAVGRGTRLAPEKNNLLLLDFLFQHEKHNLIRPAHLIAKDNAEAQAMTQAAENGETQDLLDLQDKVVADRESALAKAVAKNSRRRSKIISLEEVAVALHQPDIVDYEPTMGWQEQKPTEKQIELLKKQRIPAESIKSRGHATDLINRIFARRAQKLASLNQVVWLQRMGHPTPQAATFEEATAFLDEKWKKKETPADSAGSIVDQSAT